MNSATTTNCMLAALVLLAGTASAQVVLFEAPVHYATPTRPDGIAQGDFDRDGDIDLAVASDTPDKISILKNNGSGIFAAPVDIPTGAGTGPNFVRAVDVDADGDIDLAVTLHSTNQILILLNNGAGVFSPGGTFSVGANPRWIAAIRADANSSIDLVVCNRDGNSVTVLLNNGAGSFTGATYPVGVDPRALTLADLDGNGSFEMLVTNHGDRSISILQNNGLGAYSLLRTVSLGTELRPVGIVAGDFDHDGDPDFAVATSGNGLNFASVFINTGGVTAPPVHYPTLGTNPGHIASLDVNKDGNVDLITINEDSASISVFAGNANGTFAAATVFGVGTTPQAITFADFDRDGMPDLAVTNKDSNSTSILINALSAPQLCYANCDGSVAAPVLNANDFQCFLNKFAAADLSANCDGSTASPILNSNDFQCFLNKFAAGCP